MYAIVDFKGTQLKVEKDQTVRVPYLHEYEVGVKFEIPRVLLLHTDKDTIIGQPTVKSAKVLAEILRHLKDKKVIVFKKKKRKGYEKKQGHRQNYTEIIIKDIIK